MSALIVRGANVPIDSSFAVRTFKDGEHRFPTKGKRAEATELVVHESVTRSTADTVGVLKRRGLSVHLLIGADGAVSQHADVATDVMWHAGAHNTRSFGVEVVTPYYPSYLKPGLPWDRVIDAPWAHKGAYVLPTPAQAESLAELVRWAVTTRAAGLKVPRAWPGLSQGTFALGTIKAAQKSRPGILAHHYFAHSDGAWLVFYAWLRLEMSMAPSLAFEEAAKRATAVRRADVRDLITAAQ